MLGLFKKKEKFVLPTYEERILKLKKIIEDILSYCENNKENIYSCVFEERIDRNNGFVVYRLNIECDEKNFKNLKEYNIWDSISSTGGNNTKTKYNLEYTLN
jgi:hypothetical protein